MSKRQDLRKMELERYKDLQFATESWNNFSPKQKLEFIQKSFDQLNAYTSRKYNLNPKDVKFGFSTGSRAAGMYSPDSKSISMPVGRSLFKFTPQEIDLILRHELRHRVQDAKHMRLSIHYDSRKLQPHYYHDSSGIEIDADRFAYKDMLRTSFTGFIKSHNKVSAAKDCFKNAAKWVKNGFSHLRSRIAYATGGLIGGRREKKMYKEAVAAGVEKYSKDGLMFYSLGQLERLMDKNPEGFKDYKSFAGKGKNSGANVFKEYKDETKPFHDSNSFFGVLLKGQRHCGCYNLEQGANSHAFDRYDKNGNLIDLDDVNHQYESYVPAEVQVAQSQQLAPQMRMSENTLYNAVLRQKYEKELSRAEKDFEIAKIVDGAVARSEEAKVEEEVNSNNVTPISQNDFSTEQMPNESTPQEIKVDDFKPLSETSQDNSSAVQGNVLLGNKMPGPENLPPIDVGPIQ